MRHERVQGSSPLGVETGMGLVEEQQARGPNERHPQRQPSPLTGREPTVQHARERLEPDLPDHIIDRSCVDTGGPCRETQVLQHGQILIASRLVADEPDQPTVSAPIDAEVETEDLPDARVHREEPREEAQQRRLPGTVPAGEEDDFSRLDIEVDPGQGREPAEETYDRSETDDGLHSASGKQVPRVYGRVSPAANRATRPWARIGPSRS
jgi:hypothetical protein